MKYMLDTNILIKLKDRMRLEKVDDICISAITYAELEFGVSKSQNQEKNRKAPLTVMSGITVVPFDADAARTYGDIRASLESKGNMIGPNDTLIAAHAKSLNLTLVTNNTREFDRVEGLNVGDWT